MPYILIILSIPLLLFALIGVFMTFSTPFDIFNGILTLIFLVPGYLLAKKGAEGLKACKLKPEPTVSRSQAVAQQQLAAVKEVINHGINKTENKPATTIDQHVVKALPQAHHGIPLTYKYTDVKTCIIRDNKPDYSNLKPYMPINFIPEPSNPYDPNAVIVNAGDINIGYLYKGKMQDMVNDFLKRGNPIQAFISKVDQSSDIVQFSIGFYKEKTNASEYHKLISSGQPYKVFKLTGNGNEDMQDTLSYCEVEEEVEYEFDDEKEKYIAICADEIGYFPKSAEKYLEDEHPAFIEEIEEDENGKYIVKVSVFFESEL